MITKVSSSFVNVEAVHLVSRHHFPCARMHARTHSALLSISHSHTTHVHVYTLTYTFTQTTHTHFLIPNTHTPQLLAEFDGLFAGHRARVGDAAAADGQLNDWITQSNLQMANLPNLWSICDGK